MKLNKFAIIAVTLFAMGSTCAFAADSKSDTPKTECSKNNECYNGMLIVSLNPNAVPPELLVSLPGWILPTLNVKAFRK